MEKFCESIHGSLVSIHSAHDNDLLKRSFLADSTFLGALKEGNSWKWLDGRSHTYENWATGEPNNIDGHEYCISFHNGGKTDGNWNDVPCGYRYYTVCKLRDCDTFNAKEKEAQKLAMKSLIEQSLKDFHSSLFDKLIMAMESRLNQRIDEIFTTLNFRLSQKRFSK
ncbi:ladderlectin-like precursor [Leptotrombidium deliense]|uniref:Ladderlectin-like n=1 Tax=Leptotrombidium deliense TaxID=299467 RepID=A0A443SMY0_9ACAR|nr:ladderlectin-like precursor [Leptotrombidium deliense]